MSTVRQDGHTYIDEPNLETASIQSSGSSVVEELQGEQDDSDKESVASSLEGKLDELNVGTSIEDDLHSEDDYDIDDEDWEFADGGTLEHGES